MARAGAEDARRLTGGRTLTGRFPDAHRRLSQTYRHDNPFPLIRARALTTLTGTLTTLTGTLTVTLTAKVRTIAKKRPTLTVKSFFGWGSAGGPPGARATRPGPRDQGPTAEAGATAKMA